jgi:hypothetical protein
VRQVSQAQSAVLKLGHASRGGLCLLAVSNLAGEAPALLTKKKRPGLHRAAQPNLNQLAT